MDPVPDHYFSENLVAPGIESRTSGSVARNSDHYATEAVSQAYTSSSLCTQNVR
jgi:hypothetical protein